MKNAKNLGNNSHFSQLSLILPFPRPFSIIALFPFFQIKGGIVQKILREIRPCLGVTTLQVEFGNSCEDHRAKRSFVQFSFRGILKVGLKLKDRAGRDGQLLD